MPPGADVNGTDGEPAVTPGIDHDPPEPLSSPRLPLGVVAAAAVAAAGLEIIVVRLIGRAHWLGDVVAIAIPAIADVAIVAAIIAVVVRHRWAIAACLATVAACAWMTISPRLPRGTADPVEPLRVAAANVRVDSSSPDRGVADVLAEHADVVVVSELTPRTAELLAAAYPYSTVTWAQRFGHGVYSTIPIEPLGAVPGAGDQALRVRVLAATPFVLYALHLYRPTLRWDGEVGEISFSGHRAQLAAVRHAAADDDLPVVIAGDLNLSDRTSGYRRLVDGRVDATRAGGWAASTFTGGLGWRALALRIDHLMVPGDWCVGGSDAFSIAGSDHRGVVAELGRCPADDQPPATG